MDWKLKFSEKRGEPDQRGTSSCRQLGVAMGFSPFLWKWRNVTNYENNNENEKGRTSLISVAKLEGFDTIICKPKGKGYLYIGQG